MAVPGLAWVKIESPAVEVDGRLEILEVPESAGHALDLLNLAVESLAHRVGHPVLVVGQDVVDVPVDRLGRFANRLQPAVRRPEVPPFPEERKRKKGSSPLLAIDTGTMLIKRK